MPFALNLQRTRTDIGVVELEPAINILTSMVLLSKDPDAVGIHEWVQKTNARMTVEEQFRHKLVMLGFHYSVLPPTGGLTFEGYLETLDAMPPSEYRERLLKAYESICLTDEAQNHKNEKVDWTELLSSPKTYVDFLRYRFGDQNVDEEVETRAFQYVSDPAGLKQLIVGHIRWFWKNHLQAEWARVKPMLEESARAFNKIDFGDMTRQEMIRFVTGKELQESKWADELETARDLVFVPNAHIGPYIHITKINENLYVQFGAHLPEGSDVHIPELDRAEIVGKLSALADETRLQILKMIAENGEMRANEIMDAVNLSQPSVSRYLGQLTAAGFLQERRANGAKMYTLNRERIDKTLKAVSAFLLDRS